MTKQDAITAMKDGKKLAHRFFSLGEWMSMEGNEIVLEDGVRCTPEEFWRWRTDKNWNDGYELYQE